MNRTLRLRIGLMAVLFAYGPWLWGQVLAPVQPFSSEADADCRPCMDTVRMVVARKVFDIGRLLPEWKPVVHWDSVTVFEGRVVPHSEAHSSCHVSPLDFSGYHLTHDLSFDAVPDPAFRHLMARRIYPRPDGGHDTLLQTAIHAEWESGIAASNDGNPAAPANRRGDGYGFLCVGHRRGERLWNLPTIGDWVHLEGAWIWDRGHPPARTEIHPLRFMSITRRLPALVPAGAGRSDSVFATRCDVFASGDGGALWNNLPDQPDFVRRVRMSGRRYEFLIRPVLPPPAPGARLRWRMEARPGDSYAEAIDIQPRLEADGQVLLAFRVDWRGPETAVLARSVYCWWEGQDGQPLAPAVHTYEISFDEIDILRRKEGPTRSEWRFFIEAGGEWLFLNEFLAGEDIFRAGWAHSYRGKWPIGQRIRVHVPAGVAFRVFAGGWEADGMDKVFGHVLNPEAPCTDATRKGLRQHLWPATPFGFKGCLDDVLGIADDFPTPESLGEGGTYEVLSDGHPEKYDACPGSHQSPVGAFSLKYSVRRIR